MVRVQLTLFSHITSLLRLKLPWLLSCSAFWLRAASSAWRAPRCQLCILGQGETMRAIQGFELNQYLPRILHPYAFLICEWEYGALWLSSIPINMFLPSIPPSVIQLHSGWLSKPCRMARSGYRWEIQRSQMPHGGLPTSRYEISGVSYQPVRVNCPSLGLIQVQRRCSRISHDLECWRSSLTHQMKPGKIDYLAVRPGERPDWSSG